MKYLVCEVWFGNFFWGDIGISGKSQGSSTQKPQVSITSQTGVMTKKLWKITILKRLGDIWFGKFLVRQYRNIRKVTRVIHAKTPGVYQVPNLCYSQKLQKITIFKRLSDVCLVIFLWGDIGISGKSQGSSTWKPQVSIKSQTWVMPKNCKNRHF